MPVFHLTFEKECIRLEPANSGVTAAAITAEG